MEDSLRKKRLPKERFRIVMNTYLGGTYLWTKLNAMELRTDAEGNLPPDLIGAICLMLRTAPRTAIGSVRDIVPFQRMLEFLDPYLEPPYRPESEEPLSPLFVPFD